MAARNLLLRNDQCVGDLVTITAAIEALAQQHPQYRVSVQCPHPDVFRNNPHVHRLELGADYEVVPMHCHIATRASINRSNQQHNHFMDCWTQHLAQSLGVDLVTTTNRPHLYLSEWEREVRPAILPPGRFAIVNAGFKGDYTAKHAGTAKYQAIVDALPEITFLQVGTEGEHKPLSGAINLLGKTSVRDLIRMAYWCDFVVTPVSALHHIAAAFSKPSFTFNSREPDWFIRYPTSTIYSSNGLLPCCKENACWRSKADPNDADSSRCALPVLRDNEWVPTCLDRIPVCRVVEDIRALYEYGTLTPGEQMTEEKYSTPDNPTVGVVIGTHGSPEYIELQLESLKRFHPNTPTLVVDDCSPNLRELATICKKYRAEFISNEERLGHLRGDMAVYARGLEWAHNRNLDLCVKISRRFLFTQAWLDDLKQEAVSSQKPTVAGWCRHYNWLRTECLCMRVADWLLYTAELIEAIDSGVDCVEHHINNRIVSRLGGFHEWKKLGNHRHERNKAYLWHDWANEDEYRQLANTWGL